MTKLVIWASCVHLHTFFISWGNFPFNVSLGLQWKIKIVLVILKLFTMWQNCVHFHTFFSWRKENYWKKIKLVRVCSVFQLVVIIWTTVTHWENLMTMSYLWKFFFLENKFIFVITTACFPHPLYQQGLGKPAIAYENLSITHSLIITRCPVITLCAIITCWRNLMTMSYVWKIKYHTLSNNHTLRELAIK